LEDLILDLNPSRARPFQHLHGADHIDRVAEAGVSIDQQRQRHGISDCRDVICYFRQRGQSDIGRTEIHIRDAGSRDIDGLIADILNDPREEAVRGTGEDRRLAPTEDRFEGGCRSCHAVSPVAVYSAAGAGGSRKRMRSASHSDEEYSAQLRVSRVSAGCVRAAAELNPAAAFSPLGYHRLSGRAHPQRSWDGPHGDILFAASYWESRR
jgi:hypothetical protein